MNAPCRARFKGESDSHSENMASLTGCELALGRHVCPNVIIVGVININITNINNSSRVQYSKCFIGHGLESALGCKAMEFYGDFSLRNKSMRHAVTFSTNIYL